MAAEKTAAAKAPAPPDGFEQRVTDFEGFVKFEQHVPVFGKIVGVRSMDGDDGKKRFIYMVRLVEGGVTIVTGAGSDAKEVEAKKGDIVGVDEKVKLQTLREMVANRCLVWINPTGKQKLKGGRTLHTFDVRAKGEPGPIPDIFKGDGGGGREDDGDIPF